MEDEKENLESLFDKLPDCDLYHLPNNSKKLFDRIPSEEEMNSFAKELWGTEPLPLVPIPEPQLPVQPAQEPPAPQKSIAFKQSDIVAYLIRNGLEGKTETETE